MNFKIACVIKNRVSYLSLWLLTGNTISLSVFMSIYWVNTIYKMSFLSFNSLSPFPALSLTQTHTPTYCTVHPQVWRYTWYTATSTPLSLNKYPQPIWCSLTQRTSGWRYIKWDFVCLQVFIAETHWSKLFEKGRSLFLKHPFSFS